VKEHAVSFGAAGNLAGILCEAQKPVPGAPLALMWNVGIHHRVGAYRIWVDLARKLAAEGYSSLRFDLSGMGDSDARRGAEEDETRAVDLDEAMAFATRRTGIATFAPIGFCSGIDQLHALGLRDPRVVAMGYVEGYAWKTRGYYMRYPLRYLRGTLWRDRLEHLSERKQLQVLKGLFGKREALALDPGAAEAAAGAAMFARHRPDRDGFARDLQALRARDVKLLFAYFGLDTGFTHEGQFREMTGVEPGPSVRLFFLGGADHILFRTQDRALTVAEICVWMKQCYPRG
jgi:hypothetical protein